jgi:UDP-2,3-diacylglucosamine pyrophosphatase LpxH
LWISDVHLGFRECKAEFLLDFLRQSECEQLYLVGDLIDFWSLQKGGRWPAAHGEVLKAIVAKAQAGVRVWYVPGNHDDVARDYLGLSGGRHRNRSRKAIHVTADGRRFLVTHGDECDSRGALRRAVAELAGRLAPTICCCSPTAGTTAGGGAGIIPTGRWPTSSNSASAGRRPSSPASRRRRRTKARRRGLDGVICGHIHHAALRDIHGVLYCNDGDWVESCTALVERFDGVAGNPALDPATGGRGGAGAGPLAGGATASWVGDRLRGRARTPLPQRERG